MTTSYRWMFGWLVAFLGFPLGGTLALLLIGRLDTPVEGLIGGFSAGAVIGAAQLLALRLRWAVDWRWIVASAIGLAAGLGLNAALFGTAATLEATLLRAPLTGLLLGGAQWFILREHVRYAYVWIPLNGVIFPIAWYITALVINDSLAQGFVVFGSSGAILFQVLTGAVLWGLTRAVQPHKA